MGLFNFLKREIKNKITFLGLDSSGKSTIISFLQTGHFIEHTPTMGKNKSNIEVQGNRFSMYDMGGQSNFRKLWTGELKGSKIVVFVVDVSNPDRFAEAKEELARLRAPIKDNNLSLVVIANKIDLPNHSDSADLIDKLGLDQFDNFHILETSAKSGFGMADTFAHIYSILTGDKIKRHVIAKAISLYDQYGQPLVIKAEHGKEYNQAIIQGSFLSAITSFLQQTHSKESTEMKIDLGDKVFIVERKHGYIGALYWDKEVEVSLEEAHEGLKDILNHLEYSADWNNPEDVKVQFEQYCSNLL